MAHYPKGEEWREFANCIGMNPNDFFDNYERSVEVQLRVDKACSNCVVRKQCLEWALSEGIEYGVWGRKYLDPTDKKKKERRAIV